MKGPKLKKEAVWWTCIFSVIFFSYPKLPDFIKLLSTLFWGLLTQGRSIFFANELFCHSFPKDVFHLFCFPTQKDREFFFICFHMRKAFLAPSKQPGLRLCPTCRKKARDVSVKVSPSMYSSKSQQGSSSCSTSIFGG